MEPIPHPNVRLYRVDDEMEVKTGLFTFPGGEPHCSLRGIRLDDEDLVIDCRFGSMDDFGHLLAVNGAIRNSFYPKSVSLFLPYFPGARQDRSEPGFPLTLEIFADIIDRLEFDEVFVVDPHSIAVEKTTDCSVLPFIPPIKADYLICPDEGAVRRVQRVSESLHIPMIRGYKSRDPQTGNLSGFGLDVLPKEGKYCVVDDICDGGGTFMGLAARFFEDPLSQGSTLDLYVTHGIFSKGVNDLLDCYDNIYTTDSRPEPAHFEGAGGVTVFHLPKGGFIPCSPST